MSTIQTTLDAPATDLDGASQLGDGESRETKLARREVDGTVEEQCPHCGEWYQEVGTHWSRSDCPWPPITERKKEILRGLMLSDGHARRSDRSTNIVVSMINKTFVQWLASELGWLSTSSGCYMSKAAQQKQECNFDMWRVCTRTHPWVGNAFDSLYQSDGRHFINDLSLTPTVARMWFVSDWSVYYRTDGSVIIDCGMVSDAKDASIASSYLEQHGFEPSIHGNGSYLYLPKDQHDDWFDFIGRDPVPGFGYKWAYRDPCRQAALRSVCRWKHRTQTYADTPPDETDDEWPSVDAQRIDQLCQRH